MLNGKVAIVTGASRGVGKGVALGLAEYGATVYVVGRTEKEDGLLPFLAGTTIHKTAEAVNALGGTGIAHKLDVRHEQEYGALFERVMDEQGKLDILVNSAWAGAEHVMGGYFVNTPFWEQPLRMFDDFYAVGLRSNYAMSREAAKIMTRQKSGLIVNISYQSANMYWLNVSHGVFKAATDKMNADIAHELKGYGISALCLYPGTVRTEGMTEAAKYDPSLDVNSMESPRSIGRCVAALALDSSLLSQTGMVKTTLQIKRDYGIVD